MSCVLLGQPFDLVDFLFNLQTLQVVKVRLMALERTVDIVLPRVPRLRPLIRVVFRLSWVEFENTSMCKLIVRSMCSTITKWC